MKDMTIEELDELQKLLDASSSAPWVVERDDPKHAGWPVASCGNSNEDNEDWAVFTGLRQSSECDGDAKHDARLIAALRNAAPGLLAMARDQHRGWKTVDGIRETLSAERDRYLAALKEAAIGCEAMHAHALLAPGCFNDYHFCDVTIRVGCHPGTDEEAPCLFAEEVKT